MWRSRTQKRDHLGGGRSRRCQEVAAQPTSYMIVRFTQMPRHRSGRGELPAAEPRILDELDLQDHRHRTLERRAHQFALALRGMRIAQEENAAGDFDGQERNGPNYALL